MQQLGFLKFLALSGGNWVLYFLLFCSVLSVAVMIERAVYFLRQRGNDERLKTQILSALASGDSVSALAYARDGSTPIARTLQAGLNFESASVAVRERAMENRILTEKIDSERFLVVLGTLGNNAPFIGLFGTVLGIIKAFDDLAVSSGAGPKVVMAGISEALIATAVGLIVAIPAVIAYNLFQRLVRTSTSRMENAARQLLSALENSRRSRRMEKEEANEVR